MPFDTRAAFKLTLAVAAAISAQTLHAQENPERLWSCNLTPSGEWDCEVNESLMQQQAQQNELSSQPRQIPSSDGSQQQSEQTRTASQDSVPTSKPADETVAVEPVSPAPAAAVITTAAPAPIAWPEPAGSQPTQTATPATASAPSAQNDWNCVASGDSWDCNQQPAPGRAPQVAGTAVLGREQQVAVAGKPEWNCDASGNSWDCKEVPGAAPAATSFASLSTRTPASAAALDWYAYAPGEAPGACRGRYVEPDFVYLEDDRPLDQQPIYINALSSTTEIGGVTRLDGGIQLQRGGRLITSTHGELDQQAQYARLFGEVRYREKGLLLTSEQADANLLSGDTRFHNAQYVMHEEHMRGQAGLITRFGDSRIGLEEGSITYCEPGSNAWQIAANSIEINPETGRGVARHATLDVAGIPVLYTPYLSFPIDERRQSGFLYPSISYSESDGVDISVPYYFNLAENFDDTLTPRLISERGLLLENEFRYMNRWSHNVLSTAWLADDSQYDDSRWLLGLEHQGSPMERLYTRIDYTRVSDDDYFEDLGTSLDIQRHDHLDQLLELRYLQPDWNLTLRTQGYQTIDGTSPYERVPQLLLNGGRNRIGGLLDVSYSAEYTRFERDLTGTYAPVDDADATIGDRIHLRPRLGLAFERPWGYLRPSAMLWHTQYDLDNDRDADLGGSQTVSANVLSIDSGLILERSLELADGQYTQTLEPRLLLLHADADDQSETPAFDSSQLDFTYYNLFHETGWSGNDRVADTSQATLGLSSAIYSEQGREKLRVGIAQAYYFQDRQAPALRPGDVTGTESSSNLATLLNWNLTPSLRLTHNGEIDRDGFEVLEHNYKLSFLPDDKRLLYVNYRDNIDKYSDAPTDPRAHQQLDIAFRWPLGDSWTGYGRWQQDLDNSENLETLLGVEYSSCCWKVRLTGRSWVVDPSNNINEFETDNGIFLQFVLRGLGTFGQGQGREFLEELTGYDEDDNGAF
ncbi:LPS assembly protein LptD [Marinobacterium sediminicola]|uniref:LPS-assembly protein LptD n=2 Tax=Marinobacterium sediminicola TaxID=518898 RepID=A0ABY1RY35_9GAMM|nr:LPS assembly protein LptD [Marinobacterium sediminicola]ULG68699.1 LPS assembly protein LptD [Marinobacterium sediminicola]SMR73223.1 LPS-assembly protein [Marinobacterium sediminicola]